MNFKNGDLTSEKYIFYFSVYIDDYYITINCEKFLLTNDFLIKYISN